MDNSTNYLSVAVVGVLATCVGGLIWVIKIMFNKIVPLIENGNTAINRLVPLVTQNTKTIKNADEYLKKRNGRDAEMHKELIKVVEGIPDKIVDINKVIAKSNKGILGQLQDTAEIAAEDRDVLTNQNKHIAVEVDKRMKGKK